MADERNRAADHRLPPVLSFPAGVDPADVSVGPAVYNIRSPVGSAAEYHELGVGRIEFHRGPGTGHFPDPGRWLGDDGWMQMERRLSSLGKRGFPIGPLARWLSDHGPVVRRRAGVTVHEPLSMAPDLIFNEVRG